MEKSTGLFGALPERERKEIVLPSGRKVTILETTGKQESLLQIGKREVQARLNEFFAGVTENLDGKPGPTAPKAFEQMLQEDRSYILLQTRILSHGSIIEYHHACPQCKAQDVYEIDLEEVVAKTKPYPEGDKREFSVKFKEGEIWFELPTGATQAKIEALDQIDINSKLNCMRLWEATDAGKFPVSLENLKSRHIAELRKAVRAKEANLDEIALIQCRKCNTGARVNVIANLDFLFPHTI